MADLETSTLRAIIVKAFGTEGDPDVEVALSELDRLEASLRAYRERFGHLPKPTDEDAIVGKVDRSTVENQYRRAMDMGVVAGTEEENDRTDDCE